MKKLLILFLAAVILFSGCLSKGVKPGDNISVDYTGTIKGGKVFDTSIESVAKFNGLSLHGPLNFTVGKKEVIPGFDEGVIGMKVGETRTLELTPEKAYGSIDPRVIQTMPVVQNVSATATFPRNFNISLEQFEETFGSGHKKDDVIKIPETNINITVQNISNQVSLSYNFNVGYRISSTATPWNQTVIKIDSKNVTVKHEVKKNDVIRYYQGAPWNSTVLNVNSENITLRHNAMPDTEIPTMFGVMTVRFNDTYIILDQNPPLAGKTLIFNVTLRSINK